MVTRIKEWHDICIEYKDGDKGWHINNDHVITYRKRSDFYTLWRFEEDEMLNSTASEEEAMLYWLSMGGSSWES
jgi:hypothetical protein